MENFNFKEKKFVLVNEESMIFSWRDEVFVIGGSGKGSIVYVVFIIFLVRIKLYRELLKSLGKRVFYCDIDSVVFIFGEDLEDLSNGDFLG